MSVERTNFERLNVYRLAEELGDYIWELTSEWNPFARATIGQQIVRSVDSIGANIAEGSGRGTAKDNRRFVLMARASLYETKHWLRRAHNRALLKEEHVQHLRHVVDNLTPMLNAYLVSLNCHNRL